MNDPESYRSDDREGCLETVHAVAKVAAANAATFLAKTSENGHG